MFIHFLSKLIICDQRDKWFANLQRLTLILLLLPNFLWPKAMDLALLTLLARTLFSFISIPSNLSIWNSMSVWNCYVQRLTSSLLLLPKFLQRRFSIHSWHHHDSNNGSSKNELNQGVWPKHVAISSNSCVVTVIPSSYRQKEQGAHWFTQGQKHFWSMQWWS